MSSISFIFLVLTGLLVQQDADNLIEVSERYTVRIKKPESYNSPDVRGMKVSPDGKWLVVATKRDMLIVRTNDGEIEGRLPSTPFSMTFAKQSNQLLTIAERKSELIQIDSKTSRPVSVIRPKGYVGILLEERNGKILIKSVRPGSPAEKSELLKPGAEIVGFSQGQPLKPRSVVGERVDRLTKSFDGPPGTKITLGVIPKGKIEDTNVVLTRGSLTQGVTPSSDQKVVPVAWCMVNGFHEFRSSGDGSYVTALRSSQIHESRGTPVLSEDGSLFAFIAAYNDKESAVVQTPASKDNEGPETVLDQAMQLDYGEYPGKVYGVEIWDIRKQELVSSFPVAEDPLERSGAVFCGAVLEPKSNRLIVGSSSTIHVYDIESGKRLKKIRIPDNDRVYFMSMDVSGDRVAVGDHEGNVRIFNIESEKIVATVPSREKRYVTHVDLTPDGKMLTYHVDGVAHVVHFAQ